MWLFPCLLLMPDLPAPLSIPDPTKSRLKRRKLASLSFPYHGPFSPVWFTGRGPCGINPFPKPQPLSTGQIDGLTARL